jgi:probable HAF family extracellular repeat protein
MRHHVLLCAFVCLILAKTSLAEVRYSVTDLGAAFAGNGSIAYGINNHGDIVGTVQFDSYSSGFLYSNGSVTTLATLGGGSSGVGGINDLGQIVGTAETSDTYYRAVLYNGSAPVDLGTLGGAESYNSAINIHAQIVGTSYLADGLTQHAFLYDHGTMTDLGDLGFGNSTANDINDSGQIVGDATAAVVDLDSFSGFKLAIPHAVLYQNGVISDLGTLGGNTGLLGNSSRAYAINNAGQIVGSAAAPDGWTHAFLYQNGSMMDIGISGHQSTAYDINSSGDVVGTTDAPDGFFNAFLYHDGQTFYLNDLIDPAAGWHVTEAYGINDAGQIVGYGDSPLGPSGVVHAFLLTPVAVPEPSSVCLLAVCVPALLRRKRR